MHIKHEFKLKTFELVEFNFLLKEMLEKSLILKPRNSLELIIKY